MRNVLSLCYPKSGRVQLVALAGVHLLPAQPLARHRLQPRARNVHGHVCQGSQRRRGAADGHAALGIPVQFQHLLAGAAQAVAGPRHRCRPAVHLTKCKE